jgi:hypothetical protein
MGGNGYVGEYQVERLWRVRRSYICNQTAITATVTDSLVCTGPNLGRERDATTNHQPTITSQQSPALYDFSFVLFGFILFYLALFNLVWFGLVCDFGGIGIKTHI